MRQDALMLVQEDELFSKIISFDNLYNAMMIVSKGKWGKREFVSYFINQEENLVALHERLKNGTFTFSGTIDFFTTDGKRRNIARPIIEDRIVQHAIDIHTREMFESKLSPQSFACRKGKGVWHAVVEWQKAMRKAIGKYGYENCYVVYCDFHHYYQTIDLDILKALVAKMFFNSPNTYRLLCNLIDSYVSPELNKQRIFKHEGLAIGAVTNQAMANLYASALDFYVTNELGYGNLYVRYMDDVRIVVESKQKAIKLLEEINEHIAACLMNQTCSEKKTGYRKLKGYNDFLGFRVHPHYIEAIPKKARKREKKIMKAIAEYRKGTRSTDRFRSAIMAQADYFSKTKTKSLQIEQAFALLRKELTSRCMSFTIKPSMTCP